MLPTTKFTEKVSTFVNEIPKTSTNSTYNFNFHFPSAQEIRQNLNSEKMKFEAERPTRIQALIHNILVMIQKKLSKVDTYDDCVSILCKDSAQLREWGGEDWDDLEQVLLEVGRMLSGIGYRIEYKKDPFNHKIYILEAYW